MNAGTLSFALDGEFMGPAFEDPQLKKGPIWAAVSLLHIAGCTLVSGLEKPSYFPHWSHWWLKISNIWLLAKSNFIQQSLFDLLYYILYGK